ncbi:MAG: Gldg family protein [bacterium]|nr:Gldg family protein [bacterium]
MKNNLQQNPWIRVVLIVLIVIVANLVAYRMFTRIDLTSNRVYTLAKASKDVVALLDQKMVVKAYFTPNLPPPYNQNAKYLRDLLEDYRAYGKGNFDFQFVDPGSEEKLEKEANNFQIPPVQVDIMQNDRIEARKVYMGLVILYGDKRETLPVIQSTANLEYDLTVAMRKLTLAKLPTVAFVNDGGTAPLYQEMRRIQGFMEKTYSVRTISLEQPVPDDVELVLIVKPTSNFGNKKLVHLDKFLMRGGKLLIAAGRTSADLQNGRANAVESDLFQWLSNIGIPIQNNLVGDARCGFITVTQQQGIFTFQNQINYPFFPTVVNLNKKLPIVKDLQQLDFFFPSSIDTTAASSKGFKVFPIALTSDKSTLQSGRLDINPLTRWNRQDFTSSPFVLAAVFQGVFPSGFSTGPVPTDTAGNPIPLDYEKNSKETRIVVVGEGNFLTDTYGPQPNNRAFFLNAVDWLTQDESLLEIRTREATTRPLKEIPEAGKKTMIKYALMFSPFTLLVIFGLWKWQDTKRRKVWEL